MKPMRFRSPRDALAISPVMMIATLGGRMFFPGSAGRSRPRKAAEGSLF